MGNPVAHFEIIGKDAGNLQGCFYKLFRWNANIDHAVTPSISEEGNYDFIENTATEDGTGIPGGIGGGQTFKNHTIF